MCGLSVCEFNDGLHIIVDKIVERKPEDVIVVAVAGGSCSGKSYLCERLCEILKSLGIPQTRFVLDDYFRDIDDSLLPVGGNGEPLFDTPKSYRESEIEEHLIALIAGKPINSPVYDLERNIRVDGRTINKNPEKVIIVDGLFAIRVVRNINVLRFCVFVEASSSIRLERRIRRDMKKFNIDSEIIIRVFWDLIEPAHLKYIQPQKIHADLVIKAKKGGEKCHL